MRLTLTNSVGCVVFLMAITCLIASPPALGQRNILDQKISISVRNMSVSEVLKKLSSETDYYFNYSNSEIKADRKISKNYKDVPLRDLIRDIWGKNALTIRVEGSTIDIQSHTGKISETKGRLSGRVTDEKGEALPGVTIRLTGTSNGTITNSAGEYTLKNIVTGQYTIEVSYIGFKMQTRTVMLEGKSLDNINFILSENVQELNEIVVLGKTQARELSENPVTINSLGTRPVIDQALGAEELLKTSTGVVVRQSGGLGSGVRINLNGFSGPAVRIYFDGIPVDVFGGGLQINTIPIDALERMDVYKGVMPIAIGTDALGGGINLVPAKSSIDHLQTSYTFGSFNTHRFTLNANKNLSDKIAVSTLSYFNYSDNNYKMRDIRSVTEVTLPNGSVVAGPEEIIDAERFHDRHISGYVEAAVKLRDLSWADQLDFVSSYAHRNDENQQGAFIVSTAVGEVESQFNTFAQRLDYRKALLRKKLDLRYYGVLSLANSEVRDSSRFIYNWRGERLKTLNSDGAEIFSVPILREGRDLGTAHRLVLNYKINRHLDITVSEFFRYTRVKGEDPVNPGVNLDGEFVDPNTVPSTLGRNILGAELTATLLKEKLTAIGFYKNYSYNAESIDILQSGATVIPLREVQENDNGYGLAIKYQLHPSIFIRASFERAVRIPTETEIFGDFGRILPNYELRPEKSNNYNLGIQYSKFLSSERELFIRVDAFTRDQEDLIRPDDFNFENIIFINEAQVDGMGIELSSRFSPVKSFKLSGNFTYQSNEIGSVGNQASGSSVGAQLPNIPRLFFNLGARYAFKDVIRKSNTLEVFWNYFFTDRFSINEVRDLDNATPEFIIPTQNVHNAGLIYRLEEERLSFSLNLQNIFNAQVFDNFRIPRPGINYQFKIKYSL